LWRCLGPGRVIGTLTCSFRTISQVWIFYPWDRLLPRPAVPVFCLWLRRRSICFWAILAVAGDPFLPDAEHSRVCSWWTRAVWLPSPVVWGCWDCHLGVYWVVRTRFSFWCVTLWVVWAEWYGRYVDG
jgi:hypothetical protein